MYGLLSTQVLILKMSFEMHLAVLTKRVQDKSMKIGKMNHVIVLLVVTVIATQAKRTVDYNG